MYQFEMIAWLDGKSIRFEKCMTSEEKDRVLDQCQKEGLEHHTLDQIFVDFVTPDGRCNRRQTHNLRDGKWKRPLTFWLEEDKQ